MPVPSETSAVRRADAAPHSSRARWRALGGPLAIAAYTVAAAVGTFLALAPAIFARHLAGRRPARGAAVPAEERKALEA